MIKKIRLDGIDHKEDTKKLKEIFYDIVSIKKQLPKDYVLTVEYGSEKDFINWDIAKIDNWVKNDRKYAERKNMSTTTYISNVIKETLIKDDND